MWYLVVPEKGRWASRRMSRIGRRDARNHHSLGHWQDCDELWVTNECVHVRSSSVSSVMSASDRTKNLITRSNSVIRVLTLTMFRHEGQEKDTNREERHGNYVAMTLANPSSL